MAIVFAWDEIRMNTPLIPTESLIVDHAGCKLAVTTAGAGDLIILMHGWPELGRSWRHLIAPLVNAGYRVAIPDMRGYGASDKPADPEQYTLNIVAADMEAIAHALGYKTFIAIGHDWGALAAWGTAVRLGPSKVCAVFSMSVPYAPPPPIPFNDLMEALYPDRFFYIRYFQTVGVGEAELEAADTRQALKNIYWSICGQGIQSFLGKSPPRDAKLLDAFGEAPEGPLSFMDDEELSAYAEAFRKGGWRGPLNWYRNFDRNAAEVRALPDAIVHQPSGFLAGGLDPVLLMFPSQLETMRAFCADYRIEKLIPGAGHWVQQEAPEETIATVLKFLQTLR